MKKHALFGIVASVIFHIFSMTIPFIPFGGVYVIPIAYGAYATAIGIISKIKQNKSLFLSSFITLILPAVFVLLTFVLADIEQSGFGLFLGLPVSLIISLLAEKGYFSFGGESLFAVALFLASLLELLSYYLTKPRKE